MATSIGNTLARQRTKQPSNSKSLRPLLQVVNDAPPPPLLPAAPVPP